MKIYSVLTHIIIETNQDHTARREFTRIINVPFIPYQLEGKNFCLTFMNREKYTSASTRFKVKYVLWHCDELIDGKWTMCITASEHEDRFPHVVNAIETDILHKIPSNYVT
ncbi:MAG: hypothetical protein ACD_56C00088G0003 [uncultured bacterium]|nr:MAG: hypothetical protein ACD_56C00088G0003 [uncultured bacterium]KKQ44604.1 MAG: hypothetical protein US63_C0025G0009 [Candidatus Moranbacteria bacterium GW2011_GWC2_37_8]KKQ63244.1 MAG: hypothetical protein US82_C0002G0039 [Parcubacteria group bacterium GW2011_GWC1_38_22]KKQ79602.1 MAG: hypothetical protein UT03_C0047G0003 [Candidatus Moranbacteria bacterium GW2011_GWD2_38_7]